MRQPLRSAKILVSDPAVQKSLLAHEAVIKEELNVLNVELVPDARVRDFVEYKLKPNFRSLGQKGLGKEAQELKKVLTATSTEDAAAIQAELAKTGIVIVAGTTLAAEDVEVAFTTKEGFAAAGDRLGVVVLETTLDAELRDLGFVRELQNRVRAARKELGLEYTDRVRVRIEGSPRVQAIMVAHKDELAAEVLAVEVLVSELSAAAGAPGSPSDRAGDGNDGAKEHDVDGEQVRIAVARA